MKVIDCEQGTIEWFEARYGIPSASNFSKILQPVNMQISKQRDGYMFDLCEERLEVYREFYQSRYMDRGKELEPEARDYYTVINGYECREVGFCLDDSGRYGCSPDMLIDDGGGEIKCTKLITHKKYREDGVLPNTYKLQVLGSLLVTGLEWWDFMSYFPNSKPFTVRTYAKDCKEELNTLKIALELFCDDLDKLEKEVKQ